MSHSLTKNQFQTLIEDMRDLTIAAQGQQVMSGGLGGMGLFSGLGLGGSSVGSNALTVTGLSPAPIPVIAGNGSTWITHGGVTGSSWRHLQQQQQTQQQNLANQAAYNNSLINQGTSISAAGLYYPQSKTSTQTYNGLLQQVTGTSIASGTSGTTYTYSYPATTSPDVRTWFFDWVRIAEDYAIQTGVPYRGYDEPVHRLLDRRKFNAKEIDLTALASFCVLNDVDLKSFMDAAPEYCGLEYV